MLRFIVGPKEHAVYHQLKLSPIQVIVGADKLFGKAKLLGAEAVVNAPEPGMGFKALKM